jgi:hypothetical protein
MVIRRSREFETSFKMQMEQFVLLSVLVVEMEYICLYHSNLRMETHLDLVC